MLTNTRTKKKYQLTFWSVGLGLLGMAPSLYGRQANLGCNKNQTRCEIDDRNLIIGDRVGIFNSEGELVATGEVQGIEGPTRQVKIRKRHGSIKEHYQLAILDSRPEDGVKAPVIKIYQEPARHSVGSSLGLSTYSIGLGSPGIEATAYYQRRFWKGAHWVARGNYLKINGEANRYTDYAVEQLPISVSAFGLMGGGAYAWRENRPFSIRTELTLGITQVNATIDGDKELVESELKKGAKVRNGYLPYARWSLGSQWNMSKEWNMLGELSQSIINLAYGTSIGVGVVRILD